jgi:predicted nucleotidyltransferase
MKIDPRLEQIAIDQPYPLVFASVSGAHLYGFESRDSDWDLRGVHVLPVERVVGLETGPDTVQVAEMQGDLELDLVTHDILKFSKLLLKRNGYVLEQLFSPLVVLGGDSHEELRSIAKGCITRNTRHHYRGFAQTEWRLFERSEHSALKPLLYVFRVLKTGIHLMRTGRVEANLGHLLLEEPVIPYLEDLLEEKRQGKEHSRTKLVDVARTWEDVQGLQELLELAGVASHLPDEPSARGDLHSFVIRERLKSL